MAMIQNNICTLMSSEYISYLNKEKQIVMLMTDHFFFVDMYL